MTTNQDLETDNPRNVAIYVRTAAEQEPVRSGFSTHMTIEELVTLACSMGWTHEHITVFDEHGVSGNTSLEERPGLQALVKAITEGSIKAVFIANEARLFRDATAIQVNAFIRLCAEQSVLVITPQRTYDFTNTTHVSLFRFLVEAVSLTFYTRTIQRRTTHRRNSKGKNEYR